MPKAISKALSKALSKAVVIIPTYNERDNITKLIPILEKVFARVKNWNLEILVVDDTSPDGTFKEVQKMQQSHPKLHLLINKKKSGLGGAYLKGMEHAFGALHADLIFEFDADLSHDPERIPALLAEIDRGYDFVLGSRYIPGGSIPANWGWYRKFLSVGGNLFINLVMMSFAVRDWTSGYRAITKRVYDAVHLEMNRTRFSGYTFQIGFLHKALRKGFKITEVPIHFVDRVLGHSKIGPEYIKNTLIYILKARVEEIMTNRIFKFAVVGAAGAVVQFTTLALFRSMMMYTLAYFLAAEMAVLSNFILSNLWTFNDRPLTFKQFPIKFLLFNGASFGSVGIQTVLAELGRRFIGDKVALFVIPLSQMILGKPFIFDTGFLFMIVGILVGMVWNFTAYTRVIWKNPDASAKNPAPATQDA